MDLPMTHSCGTYPAMSPQPAAGFRPTKQCALPGSSQTSLMSSRSCRILAPRREGVPSIFLVVGTNTYYYAATCPWPGPHLRASLETLGVLVTAPASDRVRSRIQPRSRQAARSVGSRDGSILVPTGTWDEDTPYKEAIGRRGHLTRGVPAKVSCGQLIDFPLG